MEEEKKKKKTEMLWLGNYTNSRTHSWAMSPSSVNEYVCSFPVLPDGKGQSSAEYAIVIMFDIRIGFHVDVYMRWYIHSQIRLWIYNGKREGNEIRTEILPQEI